MAKPGAHAPSGALGAQPETRQVATRAGRVLITQRELKNYGGSEFFAIELARALHLRGIEVALYCPFPGKLSAVLSPSGIAVCERLDEVPFVPDVIHGQHHLPTMAALAHFPDVPGIYCWHGARPWVEQPPVHPRLRFHVVTSARMVPRLGIETGTPAERIVTIPNFVDLARFSRIRRSGERVATAVLYGQGLDAEEQARLEAACAAHGIALDKVGYAYGNPRPRPEYFLPDYDIAFAIGRSAIEAAASGCAVMPIVPQLAGALVLPETLEDWAAANFSPRYFTSADVFDADWLGRQLAEHIPDRVAEVTRLVRERHDIERAVDAFEAVYAEAMVAGPPEGSGAEFARYLARMAVEMDAKWGELECRIVEGAATQERLAEMARALAAAEERAAALTDRLLERDDPERDLLRPVAE